MGNGVFFNGSPSESGVAAGTVAAAPTIVFVVEYVSVSVSINAKNLALVTQNPLVVLRDLPLDPIEVGEKGVLLGR